MNEYINLTLDNIDDEHICCAIGDKKHQAGVDSKKEWIKSKLKDGHIFRKLNARGKIFIEYEPLETAWVPINGEKYILNSNDATDEQKQEKISMLKYTYEQVLSSQAEQVNNKANLHNTNTKMAENMLESTNILDFDKLAKKA